MLRWTVAGFLFAMLAAIEVDAASERMLVVVSDLHLGVGRVTPTRWYEIEDARWADDWQAFLRAVDQRAAHHADLVINGDMFELWQSVEPDCPEGSDVACTEEEALHRVSRVLTQHSPELGALREFATAGENRVVIVPGNHDAALLFPKVSDAVRQGIGVPGDRLRIATEGFWLSPDGLVYAEHGHQIGREVNRFDAWPAPFVERDGIRHLQRPWGERFVTDFYNEYEWKYPIIDNITEEGVGVRYGLAAEHLAGTAEGIGRFGRFLLFKLSWKQVGALLGGNDAPSVWDVEKITDGPDPDRFIVESYPIGDPLRAAAADALAAGTLPIHLSDLSETDINQLCDYRAARAAADARAHRTPALEPCPVRHLGAISQQLLRSRNAVFADHLKETWAALQQGRADAKRFKTFVFSHTHVADAGFLPLADSHGGWNPVVINTGAWQRVISAEELDAIASRCNIDPGAVLAAVQLEDLPACYAAVVVAPYNKDPVAALEFWQAASDHSGTFVRTCRTIAPACPADRPH